MKAIVISHYGDLDALQYQDVPDPVCGPGELLVRIRATALNRADVLQRRGLHPPPERSEVEIPGMEFAGEVESAGQGVTGLRPGDRVMGITASGAHAQKITIPAGLAMIIPARLSWHEAASIPEVFITAHDALITQSALGAREAVLIHAAGSGVGTAAIQIALAWEAYPVIGTAGSGEKLTRARNLGLHVGVNYKEADFLDIVKEATDGRGVDVLLDLVGAGYWERNIEALALRGRMIIVGLVSGASATADLRRIMTKRLTLRGTVLRARSVDEKISATRAFAKSVLPLLETGRIHPVVDRVFPLREIREAHRYMESDANFGKIVLDVE